MVPGFIGLFKGEILERRLCVCKVLNYTMTAITHNKDALPWSYSRIEKFCEEKLFGKLFDSMFIVQISEVNMNDRYSFGLSYLYSYERVKNKCNIKSRLTR